MTDLAPIYLKNVKERFAYYKTLGEGTFTQLGDDHFFYTLEQDGNSIAVLIKHLWGNMRSRWTDFLTTDGEKKWRHRDSEFEMDIDAVPELLLMWEEGWSVLFNALDQIDESNFNQPVFIRGEEHHIIEAINRQMMHYAYHIGQIVQLGKAQLGSEWKSLSIPKEGSEAFNNKLFGNQ